MDKATTLVHKGAMGIAVHAVRTFSRHFSASHRLLIHTDGSTDSSDHDELLAAAAGMDAAIVTAADRAPIVAEKLQAYPKTRELIARGSYFAKLELPIVADGPYFYFDSDIVWLRHASNLVPPHHSNAFSTESWSWYYGVSNDRLWIKEQIPRRVNSGFYHIGEPFPFERMEQLLERKMYNPDTPSSTDQEILAYLFRDMDMYHPEDLKRSRVGTVYELGGLACAALHFPGRMWRGHMDQIERLAAPVGLRQMEIRYQNPAPLSWFELFKMRLFIRFADTMAARIPLRLYRGFRNRCK